MSGTSTFFVLLLLVAGGAAAAVFLALGLRGTNAVDRGVSPVWVRFHVRYYTFAILFLAFDMEMAYMYPWAVVFRSLGWFAFGEGGFFLLILGLGILYAWREGGLRWA